MGDSVQPMAQAEHAKNTEQPRGTELDREDRQLVDLVATVLVDPNIHTDLRMRLHREIVALVRATHARLSEDLKGAEAPVDDDDDHPEKLLASVLVNPDLHTDLRMRLHRQIRELLDRSRADLV